MLDPFPVLSCVGFGVSMEICSMYVCLCVVTLVLLCTVRTFACAFPVWCLHRCVHLGITGRSTQSFHDVTGFTDCELTYGANP